MAPKWTDEQKHDLLKFMIENGTRSGADSKALYAEAKKKMPSLSKIPKDSIKDQFKKLVPNADPTKINDSKAIKLAMRYEIKLSDECLEKFEKKFHLTYKRVIVGSKPIKTVESKSSKSAKEEEDTDEEEGSSSDSNDEDLEELIDYVLQNYL